MALSSKSLFLYGFQVTELNSSIDFRAVALEAPRQATLNIGFYSLASLAEEIVRAISALDSVNTYTVDINRNVAGGLENRVTITSSGSFFELLFGTGPRAASTTAPLIGFPTTDQTGATSYMGTSSAGTRLIPELFGYKFLSPQFMKKNFGVLNVSASGVKEALVWQVQQFWQVEFKYEPRQKVIDEWDPLLTWMIQQKPLEFTPEISHPDVVYNGTLEATAADGKGLSYTLNEMLPDFPNFYDTGIMKFRVTAEFAEFI